MKRQESNEESKRKKGKKKEIREDINQITLRTEDLNA